jgi:hypothetical protein
VPNFLTKKYSNGAISLYFAALFVCSMIFFSHILQPMWWFFGIAAVVGFFYFSNSLTKQWGKYSEKRFTKKLFSTALIIRIVWVVFSYWFYTEMTGQPFEFRAGDSIGYHQDGLWVADLLNGGKGLQSYLDYRKGNYADAGYSIYLGFVYFLTGGSIFIARILKAIYGAILCKLIYNLTKRNFNEEVARMAAIFCMLMPNLIYYSGLHVKETEMVFLTVAFMERADLMFRNKNFNFIEIAPPILLAASLFFFRTVLGATALFAMFTTLLFSSTKVIAMGKRVVLMIWILGTVGYFVGGTISTEIERVWAEKNSNQDKSLQWRSVRDNGNKFSKYASGAVFAPLIFVIPFPTIVETPEQETQKVMNGSNYVKNIMAFFVLFALTWMVKNKKWQEYVLIGSFMIGYLLVVAMSAFAQSERFHMPALPFELIFAAFGVSLLVKRDYKYFTWWQVFIFVAIVGWSWFKLAGRGMA